MHWSFDFFHWKWIPIETIKETIVAYRNTIIPSKTGWEPFLRFFHHHWVKPHHNLVYVEDRDDAQFYRNMHRSCHLATRDNVWYWSDTHTFLCFVATKTVRPTCTSGGSRSTICCRHHHQDDSYERSHFCFLVVFDTSHPLGPHCFFFVSGPSVPTECSHPALNWSRCHPNFFLIFFPAQLYCLNFHSVAILCEHFLGFDIFLAWLRSKICFANDNPCFF